MLGGARLIIFLFIILGFGNVHQNYAFVEYTDCVSYWGALYPFCYPLSESGWRLSGHTPSLLFTLKFEANASTTNYARYGILTIASSDNRLDIYIKEELLSDDVILYITNNGDSVASVFIGNDHNFSISLNITTVWEFDGTYSRLYSYISINSTTYTVTFIEVGYDTSLKYVEILFGGGLDYMEGDQVKRSVVGQPLIQRITLVSVDTGEGGQSSLASTPEYVLDIKLLVAIGSALVAGLAFRRYGLVVSLVVFSAVGMLISYASGNLVATLLFAIPMLALVVKEVVL